MTTFYMNTIIDSIINPVIKRTVGDNYGIDNTADFIEFLNQALDAWGHYTNGVVIFTGKCITRKCFDPEDIKYTFEDHFQGLGCTQKQSVWEVIIYRVNLYIKYFGYDKNICSVKDLSRFIKSDLLPAWQKACYNPSVFCEQRQTQP